MAKFNKQVHLYEVKVGRKFKRVKTGEGKDPTKFTVIERLRTEFGWVVKYKDDRYTYTNYGGETIVRIKGK